MCCCWGVGWGFQGAGGGRRGPGKLVLAASEVDESLTEGLTEGLTEAHQPPCRIRRSGRLRQHSLGPGWTCRSPLSWAFGKGGLAAPLSSKDACVHVSAASGFSEANNTWFLGANAAQCSRERCDGEPTMRVKTAP